MKVVELAGLGPGPFCATMLADLGADVLRIDRPADIGAPIPDAALRRGRRSAAVDLRNPEAVRLVLDLVTRADILLEGFRPGVAERLGVGPEPCLQANPRLVYGRVTGWGQDGPLASAPGHDINYIAVAGALGAIGRPGSPPTVPLNVIGDFGGGMLLMIGVLAALASRTPDGGGQVVDTAMVDSTGLMMSLIYGMLDDGQWVDERGRNIVDGGAYFYETYETADGEYIALGAVEPKFHAAMVEGLGLGLSDFAGQLDASRWAERKSAVAEAVRKRTRGEWCGLLEGSEACFAPVLSLAEARKHPHNVARDAFVELDGRTLPAPAPRFSATPCATPTGWARPGAGTESALADWGVPAERYRRLVQSGAAVQADDCDNP